MLLEVFSAIALRAAFRSILIQLKKFCEKYLALLCPKNENFVNLGHRNFRHMKLIERKGYLNRLIDVMGTPDIKVITGIRRSGKSKLLEAFKAYVLQTMPDANVLHINYNLPENKSYMNADTLYRKVSSEYKDGVANFVLIDEVQMCDGFESAINGLHAQERYDIYMTGSNAFLLSSDLATLFTGRTFELPIFPFSFSEYLQYFENKDIQDAFDHYLLEGGMAGSYLYKNIEDKYGYIENVLNTLVVRDITRKYKIRNIPLLNKVVDFLMDNISNLSSPRNITKTLVANQDAIDHKTIRRYIQYLCNAYAFYKIPRYDIRGKKYLTTNEKYYLCDHSFKYAKLGTKNMDYGRTIENIVAIELKRRGYEIYVGMLYKKEIDFVAIKRNENIYIQVADNISEASTFQREVEPLLKINDAYPKILIARTRHDDYQYEGIQIIDIANWLMRVPNE